MSTEDDVEYWRSMAMKYKDQAKAALRIASEWEEMYQQLITLTRSKQIVIASLQTSGEA